MAKYVTYDKENKVAVEYEDSKIVDGETGEIIPVCQVTKKFYGNKPFYKVWLEGILSSFEIVQNKQVDIICYIYENTQPANNLFVGTYKTIAKKLNVSEPTIAAVMKKLQSINILRKVQNGVWQINPTVMMMGDDAKQRVLITKYENLAASPAGKIEE